MQNLKDFYNGLTMYRLMLYYVRFIYGAAVVLSFFHLLPYTWWFLLATVVYCVSVSQILNWLFAASVHTKANYESPIITGVITSLIIGPFTTQSILPSLAFATLAITMATASKYVLTRKKRHIFNPAAFGAIAAYLITGQGASWWVSGQYLLPFVLVGGILVMTKLKKWHLVLSFMLAYIILLSLSQILAQNSLQSLLPVLRNLFLVSPIAFFSLVMLPEPLTGPQNRSLRIYYGIVVALFLFAFQKFLSVPYTLELSLLAGNVFARIVSPDLRLSLELRRKELLDTNVYNFWFEPVRQFSYEPGQFLEYTLSHDEEDIRGRRRYFTIASSPTEKQILISTRIQADKGSSFKTALQNLKLGQGIVASNLEGEFVLPAEPGQKLAFIAGGIGITPFRSMIKYLFDKKLYRDIVLIYSNRSANDVIFKEILNQANDLGVKTVYANTDTDGLVNEKRIRKEIPDFRDRVFYVSGPEPMVQAFENMLYTMGLPRRQVKRDYFPGYSDTHQA